ncbi:MAG: hypothetical protein ACXWCW_10660 [Burkholderiales bacterium]
MFPIVAAITVPADVKVGSVVTNPQAITGVWEEPIALGKVVGFDIEIRTAIEGTPRTLAGTVQRVDYVWITTYMRTQGRSQRTFWSSQIPAKFTWERNHLVLNEPGNLNAGHPVLLDVTFDAKRSEWRGRLENEWYAGDVVLRRPFVPHTGYKVIGDWIWGDSRNSGYSCKHVALGGDSALVIWSDIIDLPGIVIYANRNTPPPSTPEWYGDLDMDAELKYIGTNMLFFTGTDLSGDIVLARVSEKGDVFSGQSAHFGNGITNGTFNPFAWHRTTPDCRA